MKRRWLMLAGIMALFRQGNAQVERNQSGDTTWTIPKHDGKVAAAELAAQLLKAASMSAAYGDGNLAALLAAFSVFLVQPGSEAVIHPVSDENSAGFIATVTVPLKAK